MRSLFLFPVFMIASFAFAKPLEIQGHRGARWVRPENTLPAFQYALESGVDTLELDMLITKDGKVVVHHDPTLNPDNCLDKDGKKIAPKISIRSLTLEEVKSYDCGSLINPRFPSQKPQPKTRIPTLDEVFELVEKSPLKSAKSVQLNIETKSEEEHPEYSPAPGEFVRLVLAVVKKHQMMSRVILQSFDYRTLKIARKLEPKLVISVLIEDRPKDKEGLVRLAKENEAQIISPNFEWLTVQDIKDLHQIGVRVIPWTPDTKKDWQTLIDKGVDGIITDNPKELLEMVGR